MSDDDEEFTVGLTITGPWREVRELVVTLRGDEEADMPLFEAYGNGQARAVIMVRKAAK